MLTTNNGLVKQALDHLPSCRWLGASEEVRCQVIPQCPPLAYVKRNKTDACALLEAARCVDITPVKIKSVEQQALQGLHRTRSLWMGTRTARINALRGFCREFGISVATGSRNGIEQISRVLADPHSAVPMLIRGTMKLLIEEIRLLEARVAQLERELAALAKQSPACTTLLSIPGIGLLTATVMLAATSGSVQHFRMPDTSPAGSALLQRSIRPEAVGAWGASPNAVTATCACCSPTAPVRYCERPAWHLPPAGRSMTCDAGP